MGSRIGKLYVLGMRIKLDFTKKPDILIFVMREIERRKELKRAWENIHPIDRPTWENFKRGQFVLPQTPRDRDFPIAAMEDRNRRAKQWADHMEKKLK
jgi:hypothetical protein